MQNLRLKFDALASHDIVRRHHSDGARLRHGEVPIPYVLTNCHNSLCAVGGTINEDDHVFGLSAARANTAAFYVPPHMAVIHQYMREAMAGCGKNDSRLRFPTRATVRSAPWPSAKAAASSSSSCSKTRTMSRIPALWRCTSPAKAAPGVGPQDIALAIIGAVFKNGYVKTRSWSSSAPASRA